MVVAQKTLEQELERTGVRLTVDEFRAIILDALREMPTVVTSDDPASELTVTERDALLRGGGSFEELPEGEPSPRERGAAQYTAMLATSYTVDDVARMLGVDRSRVRQRLGERSLYGVKLRGGWRIPRFQFDGCRLIPGVERVIAAMPADMHPLEFQNWFTLPDPDLELDDAAVSPSDWLRSGGNPGNVAELASSFAYDD